jgi:hypothetical protein
MMKKDIVIRLGGWFLVAGMLYGLWLIAATISDSTTLDRTNIQRVACSFLIVSCWPAIPIEALFGSALALPATLLIEGTLCWEAGRFVHQWIRKKMDRNASNTSEGLRQHADGL